MKKLVNVVLQPTPTHYVFCVDCSGSMYRELPRLREDLKQKLTTHLKEADRITIIWFSGATQAGYVVKQQQILNHKDLLTVNAAIDRWLTDVCLTAFALPLKLAKEAVIDSMGNSMIFMTDGYNNDTSMTNVINELVDCEGLFNSVTFVEYGLYCDSKTIAKMAQSLGGSVVLAEDFTKLSATFQTALRAAAPSRVPILEDSKFIFAFDGENVAIYQTNNGETFIPQNTLGYIGSESKDDSIMSLLLRAYGYIMLNQWQDAEDCILAIGDNSLVTLLQEAYGIQATQRLKDFILSCLKGEKYLSPIGGAKIDPNAYCILDLVEALIQDGAKLDVSHEAWQYKRIGIQKIQRVATEDKVANAAAAMLGVATPVQQIEFIPQKGQLIELNTLVRSTERANVSLLAKFTGKVVNIPDNKWNVKEWTSHQFRAFTIIQDGRLNVTKLPVSASYKLLDSIPLNIIESMNHNFAVLDLTKLPVINRKRIASLEAKDYAEQSFALLKMKAALKVVKTLRPDDYRDDKTIDDAELSEFLRGLGITSQGFAPKVEAAEAKDFYYAPTLTAKFVGASSLPSVAKVQEKMQKIADWEAAPKGKKPTMNLGEQLISLALGLTGTLKTDAAILDYVSNLNATKRKLERNIAESTFTLIMSRGWFSDKKDVSDNEFSINDPVLGLVQGTLEFTDTKIEL